ncbi:MAG: hypothetical protein ACON35_02740 [Candidatus Marinamargulisbacteria bacterium]
MKKTLILLALVAFVGCSNESSSIKKVDVSAAEAAALANIDTVKRSSAKTPNTQ